MYRVWMALVDTSREFSGVQGYLFSMGLKRGAGSARILFRHIRQYVVLLLTAQMYLKASMTVLRGSDVPPSHSADDVCLGKNRTQSNPNQDDEEEYNGDSLQKMVLLPPTIKTEDHHLVVRVYKAENVPKLNLLTKPDPFIEVSFAGIK